MNDKIISWLLEDENPAIKYRTQTELLGQNATRAAVVKWMEDFLPDNWEDTKGIWYQYYITAMAECGIYIHDIDNKKFKKAYCYLNSEIDCNCADFQYLRSLIMIGFSDDERVRHHLKSIPQYQLPDGGFLCFHRVNKLKYTPKSCIKDNMHALMLYAECKKRGISIGGLGGLLEYFFNHNIFYRTDNKSALVLNCRAGWRTIDTFYPTELMRIGLQNVLEAFCALGYGDDGRLKEAWDILNSKRNNEGKYMLNGTLSKPYLPKEHVGKPSKWVTFYALLAEKERTN